MLMRCLMEDTGKLMKWASKRYGGHLTRHNGLNLLYIPRGGKVLGVAHCDTVAHGKLPKPKEHSWGVETIACDDRIGVYALLSGMVDGDYDILLTDGEESGRSTASHFIPDKEYNWMFELDRRGTDAVCYQFDNIVDVAAEYFEIGQGSYSDISSLDDIGCCGVNIGVGYYQEHTSKCFCVFDHLNRQIAQLNRMIADFGDTLISHCRFAGEFDRNDNYTITEREWWDDYKYTDETISFG